MTAANRLPLVALFAFAAFATRVSAEDASRPSGPLSPEQSLAHFQLDEGLTIELVAAEPQVIDPVAIRFDEHGRMWVVEMRDYPNGPPPNEKPLSKIKRLEDQDKDGRYETATVFAEDVLFPTGIQPWNNGVIVTLAGRVTYFEDADDNGIADQATDWFTGFMEENPQLRANHPTFALDNHIYIANGLRGGEVRDARRTEAPVASISGRDFRFHPFSNEYEAVSGVGQFGLTYDDFGRRFVCSNRNPLRHVVLEDRYLNRNPAAFVPEVVYDVAAAEDKSKLFPLSRAWTTSNLHANQFTAACGVHIYRGDALPAEYYGNGFTCDPTGNLVHREIVASAGATFRSTPAQTGREFLATPDEWCRPVNLEIGPDGGLYVVDMYRAVIEHPQFVPDELKHRPDERYGDDRGRIYRIRAKEKKSVPFEQFSRNPEALVDELNAPNAWRRDTAARLLFQMQDPKAAPALRHLIKESPLAAARARALWLLEGLGVLTLDDVQSGLKDSDAGVLEQAIILAERFLRVDRDLRRQLVALQKSPANHPRLAFQIALSLAPIGSSQDEINALAAVALHSQDDPWLRRAVTISSGEQAPAVAGTVLDMLRRAEAESGPANENVEDQILLARELFYAAGSAQPVWKKELLLNTIKQSGESRCGWAAMIGLLSAWDARGVPWRTEVMKDRAIESAFIEYIGQAMPVVMDQKADVNLRREALELARFHSSASEALRAVAFDQACDRELRILAIRSLSGSNEEQYWRQMLSEFPSESPPIRTTIINAALDSSHSAGWLLDELESERIRATELGRTEVDRLARLTSPELQQRAAKILQRLNPEDRQKALTRYAACLSLDAEPTRGREIFSRTCATCHKVGGIGVDVAPDISDSRTKTAEQLLADVIQPNRAIDGNYVNYVVQTNDGRTFTGIISAETGTSVTLRQPEDKSVTLAREDIDVIQSTGVSLMPEGLEQNLSLQDMADLLSFIKNWRYLDGQIPIEP